MSERRIFAMQSPKRFADTYAKAKFYLPWSDDQLESIGKIEHCVKTGGQFAQAAPRADGKTQRSETGGAWAVLGGWWLYAMLGAATGELAKDLLADIIKFFVDSDELEQDFPDIIIPLREAYERPNKSKYLTVNGQPARLECKTNKLVLPWTRTCLDSPAIYGAVLATAGITSAFKGKRHTMPDGRVIRPNGVILDDLQTRKGAESVVATEKVMAILRGDVSALAGPNKELSLICNCTPARAGGGDAADQILDNVKNPQWRGARKKMIYVWGKRKDLEAEYRKRRETEILNGGDGSESNRFYLQHQKEIEEGTKCGWPHRFRPELGEVSAYHCALNILAKVKDEAFAAEYQCEPLPKTYVIEQLKPDVVMQRLSGLPAGQVPELAKTVNGFIDVNRRCLAWAICAWNAELTGQVIAYGFWPQDGKPVWNEKAPGGETEGQAIHRNLGELTAHLLKPGTFGRTIERLLIDIGWGDTQNDVLAFIAHARTALKHDAIIPSRGSPKFRFKPDIVQYEFAQFQNWEGKGNVLCHDANWHRKKVQESFAQAHGSPGSLSLYGDKPVLHQKFAHEICSEKLTFYAEGSRPGDPGIFKWERVPASRNEMLDCVVGCRVAACWWKVSSGSFVSAPSQAQPAATPTPSPQPLPEQPKPRPRPDINGPVGYLDGW